MAVSGINDYNYYYMSAKERIFYTGIAAATLFIIGIVFYRDFLIASLICPPALFYPKFKTGEIIKKRKEELNIQFKDMLYSLSSSLSAGRSVELAFRDVTEDLSVLYPDPSSDILAEVALIAVKLGMNEPVESAVSDFARRAHIDDIDNFADVFNTCKRAGGNIVEIIRNTSNIINDKIEIRNEINVMLAERRFEHRILSLLPLGMVILLSLSANDYIKPIFHTVAGKIAVSISLILFAAAYFISKRIMDIKV